MTSNNSANIANLPNKSAPTASDIVLLSDQAAAGIAKQATIGSLPFNSSQLTIENQLRIGEFSMSMPGMFGGSLSNTQSQSLASTFTSNVIFVPFYLSRAWSTIGINICVTASAALSTCTAGFYASSTSGTFNNFPTGAPLAVASANTTTAAIQSVIVSASLLANTLYWAALQLSTATTLSIQIGQLNIDHPNIITQVAASNLWTANILTYTHTYSAGSLPTLTQSSIAVTPSNYLPIMVGV